jgi:hypothetical protein
MLIVARANKLVCFDAAMRHDDLTRGQAKPYAQ